MNKEGGTFKFGKNKSKKDLCFLCDLNRNNFPQQLFHILLECYLSRGSREM